MKVDDALLAVGGEEEVAVGFRVHEKVPHKDCWRKGVAEQVEVGLQVLITRLRHRFSKDPRIQILNVRGTGYKLIAE